MRLTVWGSRGSLSVGGSTLATHTSCVELELSEGVSLFFDAGTGIRNATRGRKFKRVYLWISHFHWDHIQGLPYTKFPEDIKIISGFSDALERLEVLFDPRFSRISMKDKFSTRPKFEHLKPNQELGFPECLIKTAPLTHPGGCYSVCVEASGRKIVYAADSDYDQVDPLLRDYLKKADVAILDSQYFKWDFEKKPHYGHSYIERTIDLAASASVKKTILFSFDPGYSDEQIEDVDSIANKYLLTTKRSEQTQASIAREGMSFEIA